jgi:ParB family chromosome partitioning protein
MAQWLAPTAESRIERIACAVIRDRTWWPADEADPDTASALRSSIAGRGIVEPLLLRRRGTDAFEVVCGARRLRAARELGQEYVPAIVRELSDREALLVAAWTTVERRRAEGVDDPAALQQLLAAGLSPSEAGLLAAHPATVWRGVALRIPSFVLRARPLSRPRSVPRFAPFIASDTGVLPLGPSPELSAALRVLENVRPAALAT